MLLAIALGYGLCRAKASELLARRHAYAADVNLAQRVITEDNFGRAVELLDRHRARPGQPDMRGWEWRYLWQLCRSDALFRLDRFPDIIRSISPSADGRWLAVGGWNGSVKLYDLVARRETAAFPEIDRQCVLAFCPRGTQLALTGQSGVVRLMDVESRKELATWKHGEPVSRLAFSGDGRTLATFGVTTVRIWDIANGKEKMSYKPSRGSYWPCGAIALSSTGERTLIGGWDHLIQVIDTATAQSTLALSTHRNGPISALVLSKDNQMAVSASLGDSSAIELWDLGFARRRACFTNFSGWIGSLALSPDGKVLASGSTDQTIRLWDVERGEPLDVLRGHRSEVHCLEYLPDGKGLVSGCKDGEICIWPASPGARAIHTARRTLGRRSRDSFWQAAFSPDGKSLVCVVEGKVERCNPRTAERIETLTALGTNNLALLFSPDGRLLLAGDTGGSIKVWDWDRRFPVTNVGRHNGQTFPLCFTHDGEQVVSLGGQEIRLWKVEGWHLDRTWPCDRKIVAAAISADDQRLLLGEGQSGDLVVINLAGDRTPAKIRAHRSAIFGIASSRDGKVLGTSSADGVAKLWNATTLVELTPPLRHREGTAAICFSMDGQRVATGSAAFEDVKLWDSSTHQELLTLQAGDGWSMLVGFSPDGNTLMAYDEDTIYLWTAPSWAEIDAAEKAQAAGKAK